MEATITLKVSDIIVLIGAIAIPLCTALIFVYKRKEAQGKAMIDLTKSFVESSKDLSKAIENNTKVIEKLPETIMLHINAKK